MARRGFPSTAHEYDSRDCCVHCSMYKVNVDMMAHVCKPWREAQQDEKEAAENGVSVRVWKLGRDYDPKIHGEDPANGQ